MSEQPKRGWGSALALVVAAALTGSAACSDDTSDLPPPASLPPPQTAATAGQTPGLDLSPAEQQAVDEAKAKFDEFMNAYIDVSTADVPAVEDSEDLFSQVDQHIGGGDLPVDLRSEIVGGWGDRRISNGTLDWSFINVAEINLDRQVQGANVPAVVMQYCVDATQWVVVNSETGERLGQPGDRNLWKVSAVWSEDWSGLGQGPDGWRIADRDEQEDQPC